MNKKTNILIVNDDGIDSYGIAKLAAMAANFGDVWVVAPEGQCSGMSQRLTIFSELNVQEREFPATVRAAYSVSGTPADLSLIHISIRWNMSRCRWTSSAAISARTPL